MTDDNLSYIEQVEYYREDVVEQLRDHYDTLLARGCAPSRAVAVLRYVAGQTGQQKPLTQKEVAQEYDISTPTIRKWVDELEDELPPLKKDQRTPDAETTSDTSSKITRDVYYVLWSSNDAFLTTAEVIERSEFASGSVRQALRSLADIEAVGAQLKADGRSKEWWAVARNDTPPYRYERRRDGRTVIELVEEIAEERGWSDSRSYGSNPDAGEYRTRSTSYSQSASIKDSGLRDLTDESHTIAQVHELANKFGLKLGEDMRVTISLNKSGYLKIHDAVVPDTSEGADKDG